MALDLWADVRNPRKKRHGSGAYAAIDCFPSGRREHLRQFKTPK